MFSRSKLLLTAYFLLVLGALQVSAQSEATARYQVNFTGNWTTASTPGGVVSSAHFTTLAVATHNSSVSFWAAGQQATSGMENLAELGSTSGFLSEVRSSAHSDKALTSSVSFGGTGTSTFTITVKRTHPLFTFGSMIGPSPDWFVGLSGRSLLNNSGEWVNDLSIDLYAYDAGTEDGEEFTLSNPATSPQGVITSLRGMGKFSNVRMARITFSRQDRPVTPPPSTAPFLDSIERPSNMAEITNANQVAWLVSFNEVVVNVSAGDFIVQGTTASVTAVNLVNSSANQYRVTAEGGNLANINGRISLGLSPQQNIQNSAGVALSTTLPSTNETYLLDNVAPSVSSLSPTNVSESPFTVTITFSEPLATNSFSDSGDVTSSNASVTAPVRRSNSYEVTVTPNNPSSQASITLTVEEGAATDIAGNPSVSFSANVQYAPPIVDTTPTFSDNQIQDYVFKVGTPITDVQLPAAEEGNGQLRYELTPELPSGLTLSEFTISGIPTESLSATEFTWTATDEDGDSASLTFTIMVSEDRKPVFMTTFPMALTFIQNSTIEEFSLPAATGGDGELVYSLTPSELPEGLVLDLGAKRVSGTPQSPFDTTSYVWAAEDIDGDEATLEFTITVFEDLQPAFEQSASVEDMQYIQNSHIEAFTLPSATGGNGELVYTLTPELPVGLMLDPMSHSVSGTPEQPMSTTTYVWTVMDEDGDQAEVQFKLTVLEDLQPGFDQDATVEDMEFIQDSPIEAFMLPSATGGNGELVYSLAPVLPPGLMLDTMTHTVAGTPEQPMTTTTYVWTVMDEDGDQADVQFELTVLEDLQPAFD
ncbi:MAG: spondin domain-containing protein, partial [Gammaproteobacteria bacterium]|nr:spondin domain-containing protein [Gammaproteobacteria bacterium]